MYKIAAIALLAVSLAGCDIPRKHKVELPVPAPAPVVEVAKPTLESLDRRVTEIERRLNVARAYRERLARERAAQPAPVYQK